jgi:hypothetical protein
MITKSAQQNAIKRMLSTKDKEKGKQENTKKK